jgi:ADP-ribose pyrophosphatase YjhB (NUDIX family)
MKKKAVLTPVLTGKMMENQNTAQYKYKYKFCPMCGAKFDSFYMKSHEPARFICKECSFIDYQDPKLIVNSIIRFNDKIVLLKRTKELEADKWTLPGGYVDRGETIESAAERESKEECGIRTSVEHFMGIYSYPGKMEVAVIFVARYLSGELVAGDEILEVKLFDPKNIPWDKLAYPSITEALQDYNAELVKFKPIFDFEKSNLIRQVHFAREYPFRKPDFL